MRPSKLFKLPLKSTHPENDDFKQMVEEANNWKKLELPLDNPERQAIEGLEKWMDQN